MLMLLLTLRMGFTAQLLRYAALRAHVHYGC